MATGLQIKVGADTTEFKQEIRQLPKEFQKAEEEISQSAERTNTVIGGIFKGLMTAGTLAAIERLTNHFDKVADAASKYGETAEDIQRVGTAAEMTGGNIDTVAMAMARAGVAAAKAARGNEEFVEKFNRAGIDAVAFSASTLTERIEMVSRAQKEASGSGYHLALILEAMGDGAANIDFQRIADEMGNVTVASNDTVERLSEANDRIETFKNRAMVWGANTLNFFGELGERIVTMGIAMEKNPLSFAPNPFAGATLKELKEIEERYKAISQLRTSQGNASPSEEQIKGEIEAMKEREKQARLANRPTPDEGDDSPKGDNSKTEQNAKTKQRLLEISLQLKEAEAANNSELVDHLKYSEDLYKGILKYKDAEDGYGMAVREANAELAKRQQMLSGKMQDDGRRHYQGSLANLNFENMTPYQKRYTDALASGQGASQARQYAPSSDDIRFSGAYEKMFRQAAMTEPERQRAEVTGRASFPSAGGEATQMATETTLQKVANFLEQLNTKLPQPVLV
jgi:hypothetical protein